MEKLVAVIMGQNCERFVGMALESVKEADAIVYCDGGSVDKTREIFDSFSKKQPGKLRWIHNEFDQEDKEMNGKQRNFYLDYIKKEFPDWWCLAIDADEVVEDIDKIKKFIQIRQGVWSVKMRHLIGDLGHEDSTVAEHLVLNRLFKIEDADHYPKVEHPVLQPKEDRIIGSTKCTTIWHLAYIPNMWEIKRRYENHLKKSNIHTPEYLKQWYYAHLFGVYPKKQINPEEIPSIILKDFDIDKDEIYFKNRILEIKHFIDAIHWKEFFNLKDKSIIEIGCGRGPRVFAMNHIGLMCKGLEISEYAVKNSMMPQAIRQGDITKEEIDENSFDLVILYDVLEHVEPEKIGDVIKKIIKISKKYILISVPVIGDPNLDADPTHKVKESRHWWINQFTSRGCKHLKTPSHFLFSNQVYIFEVEK